MADEVKMGVEAESDRIAKASELDSVPCLLWDVDGTLVDTTELISASLGHVYQKYYGRTLPDAERRALIGTPLSKQVRVFGPLEDFGIAEADILGDFIAYYEVHRERERILHDVIAILIEGKRRGLPTGLVTSKNREELANTLPRLGIADYVDFAVTADDIPHPKPAPDGILLALDYFAIPADRRPNAFYIGDTVHDMHAASAAGVRGVGVTWGAALPESLAATNPYAVCTTPEALHALLFPGS